MLRRKHASTQACFNASMLQRISSLARLPLTERYHKLRNRLSLVDRPTSLVSDSREALNPSVARVARRSRPRLRRLSGPPDVLERFRRSASVPHRQGPHRPLLEQLNRTLDLEILRSLLERNTPSTTAPGSSVRTVCPMRTLLLNLVPDFAYLPLPGLRHRSGCVLFIPHVPHNDPCLATVIRRWSLVQNPRPQSVGHTFPHGSVDERTAGNLRWDGNAKATQTRETSGR